jgi:hypothetical protein
MLDVMAMAAIALTAASLEITEDPLTAGQRASWIKPRTNVAVRTVTYIRKLCGGIIRANPKRRRPGRAARCYRCSRLSCLITVALAGRDRRRLRFSSLQQRAASLITSIPSDD